MSEKRGSDSHPDGEDKRRATMEEMFSVDPDNPLKIGLDRDSHEYSPGEQVTGKLFIYANGPFVLADVECSIHGTGRVNWSIIKDNTKKQLLDSHAASIDYIQESSQLFEGPEEMEDGACKELPFEFTLPDGLPSTFVEAFGSVTYTIKAKCRTGVGELACIRGVIVNGLYDLNTDATLAQKAVLNDMKPVACCFCCGTGTVEIKVSLQKRGFVAGDRITWIAEIKNNSTSTIKLVYCRLLQKNTFHAQGLDYTDTKQMVTVNAGVVNKKSTEFWEGFLDIPPWLPPNDLGGCKLILVKYALQFEVAVKGCTKNLRTEIPISIGTTPLSGGGQSGDSVMLFGKTK